MSIDIIGLLSQGFLGPWGSMHFDCKLSQAYFVHHQYTSHPIPSHRHRHRHRHRHSATIWSFPLQSELYFYIISSMPTGWSSSMGLGGRVSIYLLISGWVGMDHTVMDGYCIITKIMQVGMCAKLLNPGIITRILAGLSGAEKESHLRVCSFNNQPSQNTQASTPPTQTSKITRFQVIRSICT